MNQTILRHTLVWGGLAASIVAILFATSHMDYSIRPEARQGAKRVAFHGGVSFYLMEIVNTDGPCELQPRFRLASLK